MNSSTLVHVKQHMNLWLIRWSHCQENLTYLSVIVDYNHSYNCSRGGKTSLICGFCSMQPTRLMVKSGFKIWTVHNTQNILYAAFFKNCNNLYCYLSGQIIQLPTGFLALEEVLLNLRAIKTCWSYNIFMFLSEFAPLVANILCNQLILTHVISNLPLVSSEIRTVTKTIWNRHWR